MKTTVKIIHERVFVYVNELAWITFETLFKIKREFGF